MCGIPLFVVQEEIKMDDHIYLRGIVKSTVLEGYTTCPYLVASIIYNTKPVHYLSMVWKELKYQVN